VAFLKQQFDALRSTDQLHSGTKLIQFVRNFFGSCTAEGKFRNGVADPAANAHGEEARRVTAMRGGGGCY
jgi:hypothetical protein